MKNHIQDAHSFFKTNTYDKQWLLIYFYPKDDTPGCTAQACSFRDNMSKFEESGVQVIGVSSDSQESHESFSKKYSLNFPLVSDSSQTLRHH